ncbi:MAG: type II secretion system protein GspJ [Myxococcota bacterium]
MGRAGRAGFTLIEVMAVILLTALVLGLALDFYVDLSRASERAIGFTRDARRAAAILDRVARDLEGVLLVQKPPELDPLAHPWLFYAEDRYADPGADQLKFVTRSHRPRRSSAHESDLAVVTYALRRGEEDDFELVRSSSPRLPEGQDLSIPLDEEDGALLLARGLASFDVTFLAEAGDWSDEWDSTTLVHSSELPLAVQIEVAWSDPDDIAGEDARRFRRRVLLPLRPLDLEALLNPELAAAAGGDDESEDEDGAEGSRSMDDCVDLLAVAADPDTAHFVELHGSTEALRSIPFSAYRGLIPDKYVKEQCK